MKNNSIIIFHQIGVASLMLLFVASVFAFSSILSMIYIGSKMILSSLLYILLFPLSIAALWMSFLFIYIAMKPKIKLYTDHIDVITWKKGKPYNLRDINLNKLPQTMNYEINYSNFETYGIFRVKDIYTYGNDVLISSMKSLKLSQNVNKFDGKITRDFSGQNKVLLITDKNGASAVIDVENYNIKQLESLLFEIEDRITKKSVGIVKPFYRKNNQLKNIITSLMILICIIALPILSIFLESTINVNHGFSYQSVFRTIYVICTFVGSILIALTTYLKRYSYINHERKLILILRLLILMILVIYAITLVLSILS